MLEYFSFVSNPIDLFGDRFESENLSSVTVKVSGLSVYSESDGLAQENWLKLIIITLDCSNFLSRTTCVRGLVPNKKTHKRGRRRRKVLLRRKNENQSG